MPESPDTKAPHQVTSPTSMAGGTSTGVRDVSRPQSGNNAGTLTLQRLLMSSADNHC